MKTLKEFAHDLDKHNELNEATTIIPENTIATYDKDEEDYLFKVLHSKCSIIFKQGAQSITILEKGKIKYILDLGTEIKDEIRDWVNDHWD